MEKKKTNLGKVLPKLALLLTVLAVIAVLMSGCATTSTIDSNKDAAYWAENEAQLDTDKGFLDTVLSWVGTLLNWITVIMPANSYILALFVFAIIIELIMLPFSIKQRKNTLKQAMLRPKEMAIRNRYKGRTDQATQQKVSQEIQELYQKENYNMMGGCLPLLIQLPIIMALYYVVIDPIKYVFGMVGDFTNVVYSYMTTATADGGLGLSIKASNGTIELLSKMRDQGIEAFEGIKTFCANGDAVYEKVAEILEHVPNFNIGPINLGYVPTLSTSLEESWMYWLWLVPVLTFVVYFFSMKINRKFMAQPMQNTDDKAAACSNNMMDFMMPIMSVFITFGVPAAVGVYWIFKSIIGVGKEFIMSKAMPLPVFTEEDYKAAEREYNGKHPKKIEKSANAGKVRSLHHIDDEDYDEKGNYAPKAPEPTAEDVVEEAPAEKLPENKMTDGASLKDESDKGNKKKGKKKGK